jgi:pilus assembly protein CpaD
MHLSSEDALVETTPAKGHPIAVVDRDEILDVELPPAHQGLSATQWNDVYRFGQTFRSQGKGPLVVAVRPGDQSSRATQDIHDALFAAGVPAQRLKRGRPGGARVVSLSFRGTVAAAPECGHWYRDVGRERDRVPYPDFGCATQRNLAGMVANPRDLVVAQQETPASSERRGRVWSRYVSGDAAGAPAAAGGDTSNDAKPKPKKD